MSFRRSPPLTRAFSFHSHLLLYGESTRLNETIATRLMMLTGSVIGAYVFGATWDDANVMRFGAGLPAPEISVKPEGEGE